MGRRLGRLAATLIVLVSAADGGSFRESPAVTREARRCAFVSPPLPPRSLSLPVGATAVRRGSPGNGPELDPVVAGQFKILTCASTSCAEQRQALRLDEFATFAALYARIQDAGVPLAVEESPCLGACARAPCVAVEHEDYIGPVALEGMDPGEFKDRVFHRIATEDDADRVWSTVQHAIHVMSTQDTGSVEIDNATIDEFI